GSLRGGPRLCLYDVAGKKERRRVQVATQVMGIAFSPDGRTLAYTRMDAIHLVDVASGKEIRRMPRQYGVADHVTFSPDGQTLASSGPGNVIRLWDVTMGRQLQEGAGHDGAADALAFSPDGRTLASASGGDGSACLWDAATGRQRHVLPSKECHACGV